MTIVIPSRVFINEKATEVAKKTPDNMDDMAYNVQKQMLYVMPVMTVIIGLSLPSGVVLYIVTSALFQVVQTYFMLGGKDRKAILEKIK